MFCVVVCGYIISIIETEQFSKLAFLVLGIFFLSFLHFRAIVIANLGSFACNFSLSENHPKLRGRRCANLCLSKIFLRRDMWVFDVRKYSCRKKISSYESVVIRIYRGLF